MCLSRLTETILNWMSFSFINKTKRSATSDNGTLRLKPHSVVWIRNAYSHNWALWTENTHTHTRMHMHCIADNKTRDVFVGVQSGLPGNGPLWHENYFDLKAVKTLQVHKKLLPFLKEFKSGALSIVRVNTRNNFLWVVCRAGQF